jgi:hypothetical protein
MAKHPGTSTGSWSGTLSHALSSLHTDVRHCSVKHVINDDAKVQEVKQSNRNDVKTPSMREGKKHGRQPVSTSAMIGVRLQTSIVTAYKK